MRNNPERHNKGLRVEYLTAELFKEFYSMDTVPYTVKGYAFFIENKLVSIGGIRYGGEHFTLFSDIKKEAKISSATILRCSKKVVEMIDEMNLETVAIASEITSPVFLKHLGYKFYDLMGDHMVYKREKRNG